MNEKNDLRACDFCRSSNVTAYRPALTQTWAVFCLECEARGPVALSQEEATRLWNTRSSGWEDAGAGLEALRELSDLAAAGEWSKAPGPDLITAWEGRPRTGRSVVVAKTVHCRMGESNRAFIVAAVNFVRQALAKSLPSIGEPQ